MSEEERETSDACARAAATHVLDRVRPLHFQRDRLARQRFHEDLQPGHSRRQPALPRLQALAPLREASGPAEVPPSPGLITTPNPTPNPTLNPAPTPTPNQVAPSPGLITLEPPVDVVPEMGGSDAGVAEVEVSLQP